MGTNVASGMGSLMDMVFSVPGMGGQVKPDLKKMSLKQVLVLYQVIERGLAGGGAANPLLDGLSKSDADELLQAGREMLEKAGLLELNEKLKGFVK